LWFGFFGGRIQRRGGRVNIPEIGSRDGQKCSGGILAFYADLRREFWRGNLNLEFFEIMGGTPRGGWEEGGPLLCIWWNF
jgi:hypothetical protein